MTAKKPKSRENIEARRRFRTQFKNLAYDQAKAFAEGIAPSLQPMTEAERVRFLTVYVQAELWKFLTEVLEPKLSSPDGLQWMEHFQRQAGGLASGKASATHSLLPRLTIYAAEERQRDPNVTKGAIARGFCASNPNAKPGTVKRYLTDLF